jgi:transcriptional regulator with XRE-family HTH domain
MTQDGLAKKIDISIPYLSQLETNKRRGSVKVLTDIAKELGITLDMILGDTD